MAKAKVESGSTPEAERYAAAVADAAPVESFGVDGDAVSLIVTCNGTGYVFDSEQVAALRTLISQYTVNIVR